jgi:hypothetical protein
MVCCRFDRLNQTGVETNINFRLRMKVKEDLDKVGTAAFNGIDHLQLVR